MVAWRAEPSWRAASVRLLVPAVRRQNRSPAFFEGRIDRPRGHAPKVGFAALGDRPAGHAPKAGYAALAERLAGRAPKAGYAALGDRPAGDAPKVGFAALAERLAGHAPKAGYAALGDRPRGHAPKVGFAALAERLAGHAPMAACAALANGRVSRRPGRHCHGSGGALLHASPRFLAAGNDRPAPCGVDSSHGSVSFAACPAGLPSWIAASRWRCPRRPCGVSRPRVVTGAGSCRSGGP